MRGLLARSGIDYPPGDLFSAKGRGFLAELDLRPAPLARLDGWLRLIDDTDRELRALTAELAVHARAKPRTGCSKSCPASATGSRWWCSPK